jgi:ABC-type amino acid transport system permease subunit
MSTLLSPDRLAFMARFLGGMLVNFEIAAVALGLGLVAGGLLVFARLGSGIASGLAASVVALMRAAPTFVVMFFLLNALPSSAAPSGAMIVALSLVPYSAAYVADSGIDALRQLRAGSHLAGLLFFPNVTRAFFVLVMSSGAGAAIGVREGITVLLQQAERLPSLGGKLLLFAIGVACFGIPLQIAFGLTRLIQHHLYRRAAAYNLEGAASGA